MIRPNLSECRFPVEAAVFCRQRLLKALFIPYPNKSNLLRCSIVLTFVSVSAFYRSSVAAAKFQTDGYHLNMPLHRIRNTGNLPLNTMACHAS